MSEKTRRILDVDVREVSLVDRAANLRQFLVLKRLTEEGMSAFVEERSEQVAQPEQKEVEKKTEKEDCDKECKDCDKECKEEQKAENLEKKESSEKKENPPDKCGEEDVEVEEEEKKKAMNPAAVAGILQGLKGKGLPSKAVEEVVAWLESQKKSGKPAPEEENPSSEDVCSENKKGLKKNLVVAILDDGSIQVEGEEICKARKFTETRTGTVKEVVTQLLNLLHEVDAESAKAVVNSFVQFPLGSVPPSEVKPQGTEGQVQKQLEEENAELKKRLEEVEKSRSEPKGLPSDQTDCKQVKKSLWNGVI